MDTLKMSKIRGLTPDLVIIDDIHPEKGCFMTRPFKTQTYFIDGHKRAVTHQLDSRKISGSCTLVPDYDEHCGSCDQSPTVGNSGMCGACFFGEADCIDPNNW